MHKPDYTSVAEDLLYLRDEWAAGAPPDDVRRGVGILRRFLIDGGQGVLHRAWNLYGFDDQPRVTAPDLRAICGGSFENVELALTGIATTGGVTTGGLVVSEGDRPPEPDVPDGQDPLEREWRLLEYREAPCVCSYGQTFNRRQIIRYYAHYLGGVHLHTSPKVRKKDEELVRRLRPVEEQIKVHEHTGLLFQLLAIGQTLGNSDDLRDLEKAIRKNPTPES